MNKLKIILLLSLLTYTKYHSQLNPNDKKILNVASPEVASIMKYADFPELDYIGKTNISVPIYEINFGKLKIPIGLSYNTKGNKAADIATSVGLGWNLNAGGNLTAKVNDMNDFTETYSYYTNASFEPEQSLAWHRQSKGYLTTDTPQALIDTQLSSSQLCINHRIWWNDDAFIDAAPDFYYVNAPGFNDKFYLTRTNDSQLKSNFFSSTNAKLKNNPNLIIKTTCGGFESTYWGNSGKATVFYQPDKFEIVGENGYIYTFNDFEASLITEYPQDFFSHNNIQVNNWYLTKVKDPFSGKEINYEYESFTNNYDHLSLITLYNYVDFGGYPINYNFEVGTAEQVPSSNVVFNRIVSSKLGAKRLKKITTDKETIDFNYGIARLDYGGSALSGIIVRNKNENIIKQANFGYSYFSSNNCSSGDYECKRLKLDNIEDSSLGAYIFYYDNNIFPPRNSSKVDFLGYFNNNSSNITFTKTDFHPYDFNYYPKTKTYFYPDLVKDNVFQFELKNKTAYKVSNQIDRTASSISKLGQLKKIIYPTGGSLDLEYENDDFIYEGEKYILGSTRISNMKLYDSQNTISKEIKYRYLNTDNTSSGQINFITTPEETTRSEISAGIGFDTGAIIGYSRIIEETTGKGYVEKIYANFNDYSDKFMVTDENFPDQKDKNFFKFMKFPNSYIQSFDDRRGKLLSVNYYKEGQLSPVKKEQYSYDYQVKNSLKVTKLFSRYTSNSGYGLRYSASNYLLTYFNNVSSSITEEFFSGGNVKQENTFSYDDARLTYKKTISSGDIMEEYYRNAKDKSIQKLIDANILDTPIEVEKKKNGKILAKQEVKYENSANLLPSSQRSYNVEKNNMETEIIYDQYDSKGNLQKYTTKDGLSTVIIWGYNQSLPIAKIEGKDAGLFLTMFNTDITALSTASNSDVDPATEALFKVKLNTFQKRQFNLDVLITTYTHDPLVGVTSITPPLGIRENYKYDTVNRLEKVMTADDNIVKEYNYNYVPKIFSNEEKSQMFIKNNCTGSTVGSTYKYIVPLGKYSDATQLAADQKALNDISINGQNMANQNGSCIPVVPCGFTFSINPQFSYASTNAVGNDVNFYVSFSSYGIWQSWTNGINIGKVGIGCAPSANRDLTYNEGNRQWKVFIDTSGNCTLRLLSGSVDSSSSSPLNFMFQYQK